MRPRPVMFSSLLVVRSAGWGRAAPRPPAYVESSVLNASQCVMLDTSFMLNVGQCLRDVVQSAGTRISLLLVIPYRDHYIMYVILHTLAL